MQNMQSTYSQSWQQWLKAATLFTTTIGFSILVKADKLFVNENIRSLNQLSEHNFYHQKKRAVGDTFQVNSYTIGSQTDPVIAVLGDGGFVVVWESDGQDGDQEGIYAQLYGTDSVKVGSEFQVNTYTASIQDNPAITALSDGGFVIVWHSNGPDYASVYGQRYATDGTVVGSMFRANNYTGLLQQDSEITALSDGGFVVVWESSAQDSGSYGVYGQRYAADGNTAGSEFQVNSYTPGDQYDPAIAALIDGGFMVVWGGSYGQDGSPDASIFNSFKINQLKIRSKNIVDLTSS